MPRLGARFYRTNSRRRVADTVRLIGEGIRRGAEFVPLRLHAGRVASRADGHKDYLGQLRELYDDFRERWRYVRDPEGLEMVANGGPAVFGLVAGFYNNGPREHGYGDCSHATAYLGAAARSVGFPVRIVTTSRPGAPRSAQSHVYPEAFVAGRGWIPLDPVAHPLPFGEAPPAGTRIIWDLYGRTVKESAPGCPKVLGVSEIGGGPPCLGATLAADCSLGAAPRLPFRFTMPTPAERKAAAAMLPPLLMLPQLWKPAAGVELPRGGLQLPAIEIGPAVTPGARGAAPGAPAVSQAAPGAPPATTAAPAKAATTNGRVLLLPKSTLTAAATTPTGQRTQLPPLLLPPAVVKAAAAGRRFKIFKHPSMGPPGWLGCLLGYGLTIRLLSFKWLLWKRQLSPWDRFMTGSTEPTKKYWMRLRVEPPPVVPYWDGPSPNPYGWIWTLQEGIKPFETISRIPSINYPVYQQALGRDYKTWSWDDHHEWGIVRYNPAFHEGLIDSATWTYKVPEWFGTTDAAKKEYRNRVTNYYVNGVSILWAAAVYAIHARRDKEIPRWFQKHCALWSVPFPDRKLREERRYFTDSDRFGPKVAPVSINGLGVGEEISDEDLAQLLSLVVKATPVPGTVDPIPGPRHRSILDWPDGTGPMRPLDSCGLPPDWARMIWGRKEKQLGEGWQGDLSRIIPGIVSSLMSIAGGGLGAAAGAAATAAVGLVGTALGTVLSAIVSSGIACCVTAAFAFMRTGSFSSDMWRQIVGVAVAQAGSIAADATKGMLADSISSLEEHTGWTYLQDTWGAGLEGETGALYESLKEIGQERSLERLATSLGF